MIECDLETVRCPLCGKDDYSAVLTGSDLLHHCPGEFRIVRCAGCRHCFLNPRPTPAEIGRFYPDDYGPHQEPDSLGAEVAASKDPGSQPWYLGKWVRMVPGLRRLYYWLVRDRAVFIPTNELGNREALDLGCGSGGMLDRLRSNGWTAQGIDLSPLAVEHAQSRGFEVFCGTLEEARFPDQRFDAVFASMVLEHLHDPVGTLDEIKRVLVDRGWFVFSVPNFATWQRRFFGRYWYALETPRHLQHFTPQVLQKTLVDQGFDDVRIIHQENFSDVPASIGMWLQTRGRMPGLAQRLVDIPHRRSMRSNLLLSPLAKLSSYLKQGGRLTVIARKSIDGPSGMGDDT